MQAAALHAVNWGGTASGPSEPILEAYAERYLRSPNRDNALGPTRPFFSTYLESKLLLQLCVALSLLEENGGRGDLGARVRDRMWSRVRG